MNVNLTPPFDEAIRTLLSGENGMLGRVQVVCLPFGHWTDRIGSFFAQLLFLFEDDRRVFEGLWVVAPPGTDAATTRERLAQAADATLVRSGAAPDEVRAGRLAARIEVFVAADLSTETALRLAEGAPADRALAVARAADYRTPGLANTPAPGAAIMGSDETWAPHLRRMAEQFAERDGDGAGFAILDTGLYRPSEPQIDELRDVAGCAVLTVPPGEDDPEAQVDARLPQWRIWISEGRLGRVYQELDAIDGLGDEGRRNIRIQLMDAAGMTQQALAELRLLPTAHLPPSVSAKLARIAAEAGATRLARDLLAPVATRLRIREDLNNALRAADRINDLDLSAIVAGALERLFPASPDLRAFRYRQAVAAGDHAAAATLVAPGPRGEQAATLHHALAQASDGEGMPDYDAVIAAVGGNADNTAHAIAACAADALRRGAVMHAFELCLDPRAAKADAGSRTLITTVEQLLINRPGGRMAVPIERVADAVAILVRRLADGPRNTSLRSRMIDLLDPSVAGEEGLAIALLLLVRSASAPLDTTPARDLPSGPPLDDLLNDPAFSAAVDRWLERETPIQVGHTTFPVEELPIAPDDACSSILDFIAIAAERGIAEDSGGPQDGSTMMLGLGTAIARHASIPDVDLKMIRTAAMGLALGGARQPARDLAETLLLRPDTPRRRRLALIGLADIYHRCGDRTLAALYAAAGLAADDDVDEDQLWHETLLIHRVLRDNGMTDKSVSVLDSAQRVLERMGRSERYGHRIQTMRLQVRLGRIRDSDDPPSEVSALLTASVANARTVLERGDATGPVGSMITQLNRFARAFGLPPDSDAVAIEAELIAALDGGIARQIEISGRDVPTSGDLLELISPSHQARYSEDVGKDARHATMAARRALDADETLADPERACLAIEICCDRAIAAPGWDGVRGPPPTPPGAAGPAGAAAAASAKGVTVVHAAFGHDGLLAKVVAKGGALTAGREPAVAITLDRLNAWSERYPFAYGTAERDANRFYTSTEAMSLTGIGGGGPTLVVGDKHLRSMPPNLLRVGDRFAGELQPMAAAPSLTWLAAAVAVPRLGNGRRVAWISGAETTGTTLATLGDRTEGTLEAHRFTLARDRTLPTGMAGASMAVVAAHGGLNRKSSAFQVVSDEGMLVVTADALGAALHNVGVVVLFVCSGGRSDAHPSADATVGLARQMLDQGVQAVVASPWPLESVVPPPWLEAFLDRWDAGNRLIEAVHVANLQMLSRWPHDHAKGLAMNVLGNPLVSNDH